MGSLRGLRVPAHLGQVDAALHICFAPAMKRDSGPERRRSVLLPLYALAVAKRNRRNLCRFWCRARSGRARRGLDRPAGCGHRPGDGAASADREIGIIEGVVAPVLSKNEAASKSRATHYAQEIENQFATIRAELIKSVISKIDK